MGVWVIAVICLGVARACVELVNNEWFVSLGLYNKCLVAEDENGVFMKVWI